MTAEIAILNKSAIALAADSAVTISVGSSQEKIFDSADKLFELSCSDPIAIMVNNNMHFMEAPLQVLIKEYRPSCEGFKTTKDAAFDFLKHLEKFGADSPDQVRRRAVLGQVSALIAFLQKRAVDELTEIISDPAKRNEDESFDQVRQRIAQGRIDFLVWLFGRTANAEFLDGAQPLLNQDDKDAISEAIDDGFQMASAEQKQELAQLIIDNISKNIWQQPTTGVIVAGFGSDEIFPTLIEFEVIGMLGGALKFRSLEHVDIDRNGDRARVLPFAQREMVDRFLYGVDRGIERDVRTFCQRTVTKISDHIIGQMELSNDEANQLMDEAMNAEKIFLDGLQNEGFSAIRENSQHEIEDMVEFMPKSEMARMAEALVNLTSIKRRVSRGIETVGGPIDVAVISKAEGFVWVKRKHYFPAELNARYFDRINR
jgi:polyhydroxyalkanoate synthesis regulator phasin